MEYNILYKKSNLPKFLDTSVKMDQGHIILNGKITLELEDKKLEFYGKEIKTCKLKKYYKVGTYIYLKINKEIINIFVPRINLFNWFVVNNSAKTKLLYSELIKLMPKV